MKRELMDKIYRSEPVITFCDSFNGLSPLWNYDRHQHPYLELIYRKAGQGSTDTGAGLQNFSFFDTMVYPANTWHEDRFSPSAQNICYCMWVDIPEAVFDTPLQVQDKSGRLGNLFLSIFEEYQSEEPSSELLSLMVRTLLIQILIFNEKTQVSMVDRTIQYLKAHMAEKISVDELSNISFMSKSYLSRRFKEETGVSIIEYLNNLRIEQAELLLVTTKKTVNEIAFEVGFESPKYFFRVFKSRTGETPAVFRKNQGNRSSTAPINPESLPNSVL